MTKSERAIPVEILHELLRLNASTGSLTWSRRSDKYFSQNGTRTASHTANLWNSVYANTEALNCIDQFGHLVGRIFNKLVYAHRVVFAMARGNWPVNSIDHINGVAWDNRPENLRDVEHKYNLRNLKRGSRNTSGVVGVNRFKRDGNWVASITVDGRSKHLGYFDLFADAVMARKAAEAMYGFHENHGRRSA